MIAYCSGSVPSTAIIASGYLFLAVTYLFVATLGAGLLTVVLAFGPRSGARRLIGIGACVVATFGSFGLIAYSNKSGASIRLVIPNDFVGKVEIRVDEASGTPPTKEEGVWVYRLDNDGMLVTSDDRPFYKWHQMRTEFRDGRVIVDYAGDEHGAHGFKLTGGEVTVITTEDSSTRVHQWTIERSDVNKEAMINSRPAVELTCQVDPPTVMAIYSPVSAGGDLLKMMTQPVANALELASGSN